MALAGGAAAGAEVAPLGVNSLYGVRAYEGGISFAVFGIKGELLRAFANGFEVLVAPGGRAAVPAAPVAAYGFAVICPAAEVAGAVGVLATACPGTVAEFV